MKASGNDDSATSEKIQTRKQETRMRTKIVAGALVVLVLAAAQAQSSAVAAEEKIRAVAALPKSVSWVQRFVEFIKAANEKGKGIVQIEFVGGPEAIPGIEQPQAVKNGIVDMAWIPAQLYLGIVPELDALIGSNAAPPEYRKNGGLDLLNSIVEQKMNAHLLAAVDGGDSFHIYLRTAPKRTPDGGVDLSGLKLRGAPLHREFFIGLNAVFVGVPAPEVYTALERGTVDGLGWPTVGITELGWDKHLKYKIDPGFYNTDPTILVNLDRWKRLSPAARNFLTKFAQDWEVDSADRLRAIAQAEVRELEKRGIETLRLSEPAAARYLGIASEAIRSRMKARNATHVEELAARFWK